MSLATTLNNLYNENVTKISDEQFRQNTEWKKEIEELLTNAAKEGKKSIDWPAAKMPDELNKYLVQQGLSVHCIGPRGRNHGDYKCTISF